MVVNRAVVRDLCAPIDAAKAFSQLMLIMGRGARAEAVSALVNFLREALAPGFGV